MLASPGRVVYRLDGDCGMRRERRVLTGDAGMPSPWGLPYPHPPRAGLDSAVFCFFRFSAHSTGRFRQKSTHQPMGDGGSINIMNVVGEAW